MKFVCMKVDGRIGLFFFDSTKNFRWRYYRAKFDVGGDDCEFRKKVAWAYVEGLCWVLQYYYQVNVIIWVKYIYWNFRVVLHGIGIFPITTLHLLLILIPSLNSSWIFAKRQNRSNHLSNLWASFQLLASKPILIWDHWIHVLDSIYLKNGNCWWLKIALQLSIFIRLIFASIWMERNLLGKVRQSLGWYCFRFNSGVALLPFVDEQRLLKTLETVIESLTDFSLWFRSIQL